MQPSRARLICRSQNPFTPSIALWQHFELPGRPFVYHQRLSYSTNSKAEPDASSTLDFNHIQSSLIPGTEPKPDPTVDSVHPQSSPTIKISKTKAKHPRIPRKVPLLGSRKARHPATTEVKHLRLSTTSADGPHANSTTENVPHMAIKRISLGATTKEKHSRKIVRRISHEPKTELKHLRLSITPADWPHANSTIRSVPPARAARSVGVEVDSNSSQLLLIGTRSAVDQNGDYEGVIMEPRRVPSAQHVADENLPWAVQSMEKTVTGQHEMKAMERLNIEIMKFHEFATPNRYEALARRTLIEKVRSHVRRALPYSPLEVFGSERTGLALAISDIDFRLSRANVKTPVLPPPKKERQLLLRDLEKLHISLLRKKQYAHCTILHARYPLLSLRDRNSGLDVQIVLSNDTSLSRSMIQKYIQEYPYIRQVFTVVKSLFGIRGMSDTFRGGFGSYPIFMMIVASLRHCTLEKPLATAAEGLLAFITFWSTFDTTTKGISIEPAEFYDKDTEAPRSGTVRRLLKAKEIEAPPNFYLSLRDPADPTNDLGRKGLAIKHVQATLSDLLNKLKISLIHNSDASILAPLVGPIFVLTHEQRMKLRAKGQADSKELELSLVNQVQQIQDSATPMNDSSLPDLTETVAADKDEAVKLDPELFGNTGDALTHHLGTPSAEEWAGESESELESITQDMESLGGLPATTASLPTEQENVAKDHQAPWVPSTEHKEELTAESKKESAEEANP